MLMSRMLKIVQIILGESDLEQQVVMRGLGIHAGQPVLVAAGDVNLVASQLVADLPEFLTCLLEDLHKPLVPQLLALQLLPQLCEHRHHGLFITSVNRDITVSSSPLSTETLKPLLHL